MWGEQKARQMLSAAGFTQLQVMQVEGDIFNNYFIASTSWLLSLTIEKAQKVSSAEDRCHLKQVSHPRLAETPFRSTHLTLFDLGPDQWLLFWHVPPYAPYHRKRQVKGLVQLPLLDVPMQEKAVGADQTPVRHPWLRPVPKATEGAEEKEWGRHAKLHFAAALVGVSLRQVSWAAKEWRLLLEDGNERAGALEFVPSYAIACTEASLLPAF
jgi:hypothetical protein